MEHTPNNTQFCQSCGMPLGTPEDFGTEKDGSKSADYCQYCYQKGDFTADANVTMEQMIDLCAPYMVEQGASPTLEEARAQMQAFFPTLKRWAKR